MNFRVLYHDESFIAIDKPAGFHVHPPEDLQHRISRNYNCLHLLRKQTGQYLYPVHRLDRATSGVLLFAFNPEMARKICDMFQFHQVKKTYYCVVRGWTETSEVINYPLRSESENELRIPAITSYERIAKVELPYPVGRYPTTRYSLLRVQPKSGRKHQIRRHLVHLSHPLIGDTVYGDGEHNRFFREHLSVSNLLLKAYTVEFPHPQTQEPVKISSRWNKTWHQIFDLFGQCPFEHTT